MNTWAQIEKANYIVERFGIDGRKLTTIYRVMVITLSDLCCKQQEQMVIHACNPALGRLRLEDAEFEASL